MGSGNSCLEGEKNIYESCSFLPNCDVTNGNTLKMEHYIVSPSKLIEAKITGSL
jgi:hypothetical protein